MKILASSLRLLVRPGLALAATVFCLSACIATPAMEEPDPSVEEAAELSVQDPERLERKSTDAEFIAALQAEAEANINADWVRGISVDAVDMYFRWPGMDGLVDLYRATGERRYIDLAVAMASRYIDVGRDQNGDGYLDWFSSWVDRYSHGHVEFRAADGIARVAEVLDSDPGLAERFGSEKSEFVEYLEKDVWGKAKARGFGTQNMIDSKVTHFVGRSGVIAISLYKITGKREYLDWVERRGMELKRSLVLGKNGAYTFNCGLDGSACSKGLIVDTSHAGDTVNFIVAAYELGFVFDDVDIERLAGTVKRNLWNGSNTEPRFNDRIDGSDEFKNKGANQGGWIKLAAYDDELKALYKEWVTTLKPVPESDTFKSRQSVRVHILGNLAWACSQ